MFSELWVSQKQSETADKSDNTNWFSVSIDKHKFTSFKLIQKLMTYQRVMFRLIMHIFQKDNNEQQ